MNIFICLCLCFSSMLFELFEAIFCCLGVLVAWWFICLGRRIFNGFCFLLGITCAAYECLLSSALSWNKLFETYQRVLEIERGLDIP